jgi:hypothetical protein
VNGRDGAGGNIVDQRIDLKEKTIRKLVDKNKGGSYK